MIGPGLQSEKWRWSGLIDLEEGSGILAVGAFQPLKLAQIGENLSFADLAVAKSLEHSRRLEMMEMKSKMG
jgi:hypothetical protein